MSDGYELVKFRNSRSYPLVQKIGKDILEAMRDQADESGDYKEHDRAAGAARFFKAFLQAIENQSGAE